MVEYVVGLQGGGILSLGFAQQVCKSSPSCSVDKI